MSHVASLKIPSNLPTDVAKEVHDLALLYRQETEISRKLAPAIVECLLESKLLRIGLPKYEPPRLYRRVIYLSQAAMPDRVKLS